MPAKILAIVIPAVLVVSGGIYFGLKYLNESMENQQTIVVSPTPVSQTQIVPEIKNPQITLLTEVVPTTSGVKLEIGFSPAQSGQNIVAMALRLNLNQTNGTLRSSTGNPTIEPTIKQSEWNFPFAKLETQPDGSINLDVAAFYLSTGPYILDPQVTWFSIPLEGPVNNLTLTIDPTESKFMDAQAEPLHFIQEGVAVTL